MTDDPRLAAQRYATSIWSGRACVVASLLIALALAFASPAVAQEKAESSPPPPDATSVYSPGGWATLHRGPANRKLVPGVSPVKEYRSWQALEGAAVLTAPTMSPDGRTLYVTTGRDEDHSNLHAFSIDGEPLWQAKPASSEKRETGGIDGCAILSSAIVDRDGVVYIGDCDEVAAFRADGTLKWIVDLPPLQDGDWHASADVSVNALTTAAFTQLGDLFGVTNMGDVVVLDRETGRSRIAPTRLPGLLPPASSAVPMPETVFGNGLIDPALRVWAWELLMGGSMRSANTPAVDFESGRIFVAATSEKAGHGALYAIDLVETNSAADGAPALQARIAFATDMGLGSGSSPSLSPEGDRVYVSDDSGVFYSVDARTGEVHWQVQTKAASAAAAVGANGDVYALQAFGPALIAITREGRVRWQSDLGALAKARLPSSWLLGDSVSIGNGNPTVLDDVVLVPVVYGYETTLGRRIPWPVESSLVAVDIHSGKGLRDVVDLADDSTGITVALPDGTLVNSLGTALTSGTTPLMKIEALLPGDLRLLRSVGGIQVSRPTESSR